MVFIEALANLAKVHGWAVGTKSIFAFTNDKQEAVKLIKEYGQISLETLTKECANMIGTGAEVSTRMAQNIEQCRDASWQHSPHIKARLFTHRHNYTVTAKNANGKDEDYVLAPLMYKVIMTCATIDSKATEATLCERLSNMPTVMVSVNMYNGSMGVF